MASLVSQQVMAGTTRRPLAGRSALGALPQSMRCSAVPSSGHALDSTSRRQALQQALLLATSVAAWPTAAGVAAAATAADTPKMICDSGCMAALESSQLVTTPSGLQYRDIVAGTGPKAEVGYQAVVHYVAQLPNGRIFENSLERGAPFDIRVGTGQVVPGLDEALSTMRVGGVRRVYVPGPLSFPKSLKAAAGRPTVPANSPVVFDVQLLYIPGLEDEE